VSGIRDPLISKSRFSPIAGEASGNGTVPRYFDEGEECGRHKRRETKMPLVYRVSPDDEQAHIVGHGKVTTTDCIRVIKALRADPLFDSHFNVLADVRGITYEPAEHSEILQIATSVEMAEPIVTGNVAIIAKGALLFTAVLLATHIRTSRPINVRVFSDPVSAQAFCMKGRLISLSQASR
jgi:hypothetical protein